jgi:hypothetical protein
MEAFSTFGKFVLCFIMGHELDESMKMRATQNLIVLRADTANNSGFDILTYGVKQIVSLSTD